MIPLSVVCWRWGNLFEPVYVNRLHAMLTRHLHVPFVLHCVTEHATFEYDSDIVQILMPSTYELTPRCQRRMWHFSREFRAMSDRILAIDLDVVIVDDITPLVSRPEPIVGWKVGHAGVYSGSFLLFDAGALDGAWQRFASDPEGYPESLGERCASDQAMVNAWLRETKTPVFTLTEADGFVSYYGAGYERLEHLGVGPNRPELPKGARIVVLGSADKAVMDEGRFAWIREHWVSAEIAA